MMIGEHKKLQVKLGQRIYIYRGKIINISEDEQFLTIQDIKAGAVRIRLSEIVVEESYDGI